MHAQRIWPVVSIGLATPQHIRNWTVKRGYIGGDFAAHTERSYVVCDLAESVVRVPWEDFETVYALWLQYKA